MISDRLQPDASHPLRLTTGDDALAIVVSGLPGAGKTTLATELAETLGLPLISKDAIKEAIADATAHQPLPNGLLGQAAVSVMLCLASAAPAAVLESFFHVGVSEPELVALARPLVQVHCHCPEQLARTRFEHRAATDLRHPSHRAQDDWRRFAGMPSRLDLQSPCIDVDTTNEVDVRAVATAVIDAVGYARRG